MARLLFDRYLTHDGASAYDLATGDTIDTATLAEGASPGAGDSSLSEVLEHGREGVPRWVVADAAAGAGSTPAIRRAAAEAQASGFIPIAVPTFLQWAPELHGHLMGRALLLIARPGTSMADARRAVIAAAAQSPRPHVLLTVRGSGCRDRHTVREARAIYAAQLPVTRTKRAPEPPADVTAYVSRCSRAAEFIAQGRHAAAERLLREIAAALTRRRAQPEASRALIALARLLLDRGRPQDADRTLEEAASLAHAAEDHALAVDARVWQAWARADAGQLTSAESIARAVLLTGGLGPAMLRWAQTALARVLVWQGRAAEVSVCELELNAGDAGDVDPRRAALIAATAVWIRLEQGNVYEGGRAVRDLLTRSVHADADVRALAAVAHVRWLVAAGDLASGVERLREALALARAGHVPLVGIEARLVWSAALRVARRANDMRANLASLRRAGDRLPPLLRQAVARELDSGDAAPSRVASAFDAGSLARTLIEQSHEESEDRDALRKVLETLAETLCASRVDLCSSDAGPATTLLSAGTGLPTRIAPRVLEAGIVIGPEGQDGREAGVPVRLGRRLLGAVAARWPADTSPPEAAVPVLTLAAAVAAPRLESMHAAARHLAATATAIPELVGVSAQMADVRRAVARAAAAPFSVLIEGESGVGKELVARALHHLGPRRERRFCDVNCAALPDDLLESELFGHARGAFSGAVADRAGLFEEADGGTIFLDEVADLSARAQAKLLRVLQQQEVRRVGESFTRKVDVRVVAAANRDMRSETEGGRFRQDLLYRLDVIRVVIPPLRERPGDIAALVEHFWRAAAARIGTRAALAQPTVAALSRYHWPGNVRELQNVVAALAVGAPVRGRVGPSLLPAAIAGCAAVGAVHLHDARRQFERGYVQAALAQAGGSRTRAARALGLSRQGLLKTMTRVGLEEKNG